MMLPSGGTPGSCLEAVARATYGDTSNEPDVHCLRQFVILVCSFGTHTSESRSPILKFLKTPLIGYLVPLIGYLVSAGS